MAKVKCEYCGHFINDTVDTCPKCGAVNNYHRRHADITPQTINELKNWYVARNLPPEHITRFFVGQNIKEPRAFGIYENNGEFVVYKNKSDGSRAIRYQGADEAYAVNEFYIRLKQEIINQNSQMLKKMPAIKTKHIDQPLIPKLQMNNITQIQVMVTKRKSPLVLLFL